MGTKISILALGYANNFFLAHLRFELCIPDLNNLHYPLQKYCLIFKL